MCTSGSIGRVLAHSVKGGCRTIPGRVILKISQFFTWCFLAYNSMWGRGSGSALVYSLSNQKVCGSPQVFSVCFDTSLAIYMSLTCSHQFHRLVHQRSCHVLSCLCNNACKRSLAICRKSRAPCPISRHLSVPI